MKTDGRRLKDSSRWRLAGGRENLRLYDSGGWELTRRRGSLRLYESGGWGLTGRRGRCLRLYEWWVETDGRKREP